jgi:PhzF family phenazine biosynthesis protein
MQGRTNRHLFSGAARGSLPKKETVMQIERISAFALGDQGGNPAGVVIGAALPEPAEMQRVARKLGYSETVFAAQQGEVWITRYYAPVGEVAFCGHATIALGYALGQRFGAGVYALALRDTAITVEVLQGAQGWQAVLTSPPTWSRLMRAPLLAEILTCFGLTVDDLDPGFAPALANAGVTHAVLALQSRDRLAAMAYDFAQGQALMLREGLTTISLLWREGPDSFVARNAFASGGVVEDPATGAAAAALGGLLVDMGRGAGRFSIRQGEDMGAASRIEVEVSGQIGAPVRVGGGARRL